MKNSALKDAQAGYQRHHSTNAAHYFAEGERESACKRAQRTNDGEVIPQTNFMVCSHCEKALQKQQSNQ